MRKIKTAKVVQSVKFTGYGPDWHNYPPEWDVQTKRMLEEDGKEIINKHEEKR